MVASTGCTCEDAKCRSFVGSLDTCSSANHLAFKFASSTAYLIIHSFTYANGTRVVSGCTLPVHQHTSKQAVQHVLNVGCTNSLNPLVVLV